jgi:hypothetical protein
MTTHTVDKFGIDPLRDGMFDAVKTMTIAKQYTVKAEEHMNPQIVAFDNYGSTAYYEILLIANGLMHQSEFVSGLKIVIPTATAAKTEARRRNVTL